MELDNQMLSEKRIVKLLDESMLSDTTYVGEEQETGCGGEQRNDTCSTPAENKMPAAKTPQSKRHVTRSSTSSVHESQNSASVSVYEDALAELSSTKTPVLPTRTRATPVRRSARKAAQSNGDWLLFVFGNV